MNPNIEDIKRVIKFDKEGTVYKRVRFPTQCVCPHCHGYCEDKHNKLDKDTAYAIALIQHGYFMAKWEGSNVANMEFFPEPCKCECQHEWDRETIHMFEHKLTCKKCGVTFNVDSSG